MRTRIAWLLGVWCLIASCSSSANHKRISVGIEAEVDPNLLATKTEREEGGGKHDESPSSNGQLSLTSSSPINDYTKIYFHHRSNRVRPESEVLLKSYAREIASSHHEYMMLAIGHTSNKEGSENEKIELSLARATYVKKMFVLAGIKNDAMLVCGVGDHCPYVPLNSLPEEYEERFQHVSFLILEIDGKKNRVSMNCDYACSACLPKNENEEDCSEIKR